MYWRNAIRYAVSSRISSGCTLVQTSRWLEVSLVVTHHPSRCRQTAGLVVLVLSRAQKTISSCNRANPWTERRL